MGGFGAVIILALIMAAGWWGVRWLSEGNGGLGESLRIGDEPRRKLKRATELKKEGPLDEAADYLLDLLQRWERNPPQTEGANTPEYPEVGVYWKAANYLQRAGRSEEAWAILDRLLRTEYPQMESLREYYKELRSRRPSNDYERRERDRILAVQPESSISRELAEAHDKARLFMEREGREVDAVRHALLSYAVGLVSFWYDAQDSSVVEERFKVVASEETIRENAETAASTLDRPEVREPVEETLSSWVENLPDGSLDDLSDRLEAILAPDEAS